MFVIDSDQSRKGQAGSIFIAIPNLAGAQNVARHLESPLPDDVISPQHRVEMNAVIKSMFCARDESKRIARAEALAAQAYDALGLGADFRKAIAALRRCLEVPNVLPERADKRDLSRSRSR